MPGWLGVLTRIDPLTYVVDPMRRAVFEALGKSAPGVMWGGVPVPVSMELLLVAAFAIVALTLATIQFNRSE